MGPVMGCYSANHRLIVKVDLLSWESSTPKSGWVTRKAAAYGAWRGPGIQRITIGCDCYPANSDRCGVRGTWKPQTWEGETLVWSLTSCVAWDRSLDLSELHSLQVKGGGMRGPPFEGSEGSMGSHHKSHAAVPNTK